MKVRELGADWAGVSRGGDDRNVVSAKLQKFHGKIKDFFDWFEQSFPKRREQTGQHRFAVSMRRDDPSQRRLKSCISNIGVSAMISFKASLTTGALVLKKNLQVGSTILSDSC